MDVKKNDFERLIRENKDTIYTVCYMFSKDQDEVADLYQESLINLWKGLSQMKPDGNVKGVDIQGCAEYLYLFRKKEEEQTYGEADHGYRPV